MWWECGCALEKELQAVQIACLRYGIWILSNGIYYAIQDAIDEAWCKCIRIAFAVDQRSIRFRSEDGLRVVKIRFQGGVDVEVRHVDRCALS